MYKIKTILVIKMEINKKFLSGPFDLDHRIFVNLH